MIKPRVGVEISRQKAKAVNRFLGRRVSYPVTLCDRRRAALRRVRDDIQQHVAAVAEEKA